MKLSNLSLPFYFSAMLYVAFSICQYFYYTSMPVVMKLSSATVSNLSELTSDMYTLIIGLFLFGYKVCASCFISNLVPRASCLF